MLIMRRIVAATLLSMTAALPAAAQFEGTVSMKMDGVQGDMKYMVKGNKLAYMMSSQGMEMRVLVDAEAQKAKILIPMAMGDSKGMIMTMDLKDAAAESEKNPPVVKPLGTSETIAGYRCDDFEVTQGKNVTRMCITKELGRFTFAGAGRGRGAPSWVHAFGEKGGFPLKVWTGDGKVAMEVTSVDKGRVPDSTFE